MIVRRGDVRELFVADRANAPWPNERAADGAIVRPELRPGVLNSPHAVTADASGNLYVTEWLLGGRVTKLERAG